MQLNTINNQPYSFSEYWKKLGRYGFLIPVLARRELKIKYSRTLIGVGWFFIQPLAVVIVYSIFFKYLIHIQSDNIPYSSFVFSGLVLWYLFTNLIGKSTFALIESSELINKVAFPRIIIIIAKIVPVLLENLVLLILLLFVTAINGQVLGFNIFTAMFYFTEVFILGLALGILCSIIALRHRDIAHTIPIAINFGIWLTPVFFPISIVPETFRNFLLYLNPLASSIEGLRGAIFKSSGISMISLIIFTFSLLLLVGSFFYFIKFEKKIVENL